MNQSASQNRNKEKNLSFIFVVVSVIGVIGIIFIVYMRKHLKNDSLDNEDILELNKNDL